MSHRDLRVFIEQVAASSRLRRIRGADPHLEIGGITEVAAGQSPAPALLFEDIVGARPGHRVFTNPLNSPERAAIALGIDPTLRPVQMLRAWMERRRGLRPLAPVRVESGPVLENRIEGDAVDLGTLVAPTWHRHDGGPYIGSGSLVVMRDPDTGWINASIYRVQVHGPRRVTVQFDHLGRHGAIIARKYWEAGKPCPVAVVNGDDPALFVAGFESLPEGVSELDFAGALRGSPIEIIDGPVTGLPIPARAEIVLEGHLLPVSELTLPEGPFAEFTGYYAADRRPGPVMDVAAILHRDDPILMGSPPLKPPRFHMGLPFRGAGIWANLEAAGITDVAGVWQHVSSLMTVVSLKQRYDGHARRAGLIAAANAYMGRMVVVVDEDIDPSNIQDVLWAINTRAEPSESVEIIRKGWSSALDPRIPAEDKARGISSNSKLVIDACRPFVWREDFPQASALSIDEARAIEDRWGRAISGEA
jgi:4-hydroxy-3-polyprenylbenzoate decarboxylase